eukprot:CAMPEP_0204432776 /NCGR_PEP_ID=MMETSP0470-20130426/68000_1 /ASSEMBLY_ACC=CAM_ASM_000385 /TAXON_ID=2969 /ORGANISM="Oxyrrhis marina" /LENGTH=62 /DNA_ID=CAMNT_0051431103 /DNA_START=560 /DNA_END=748 /DNA_ORIENTATION=+
MARSRSRPGAPPGAIFRDTFKFGLFCILTQPSSSASARINRSLIPAAARAPSFSSTPTLGAV